MQGEGLMETLAVSNHILSLQITCINTGTVIPANSKWVAVPLSGAGGRIAVLSHTQPKRLMEGVIPSLVNSNSVTDFAFDPFNPNILAVGELFDRGREI